MTILKQADDKSKTYQERFFSIWLSLYRYYASNPNALKFFEQFVNSPFNTEKKGCYEHFLQQVFNFFDEGVREGYFRPANPLILGVLAHGNIVSAAKIHGYGKISLGEEELQLISQMLWEGLKKREV